MTQSLAEDDRAWAGLRLPPNLAIVGTVNVDESTHGFSRKVLDRAFTLEVSDIDLREWGGTEAKAPEARSWPLPWCCSSRSSRAWWCSDSASAKLRESDPFPRLRGNQRRSFV